MVKLNVAGTANISGNIYSNGGNGTSDLAQGGGGSGGSIWINTNTLIGSGAISARGGNGIGTSAGGGGGGRIAIYYTTDNSSTTTQAYGGTANGSLVRLAGAGTIYKKAASQTHGDLIIDNNDQDYADDAYIGKTPINETITFDDVTLQNYGHLDVQASANITYSTLTWSNQGVITDSGGTMALLSSGGSLTVPATARLLANTARTFTGLTVEGTLTHSNNTTAENYKIDYTINGDANIISGGQINVQGKGFTSASGPGAGIYCGGYGSGAGHGGTGGVTADAGSTGGITYDTLEAPTLLGSGGGNDGGGAGSTGGGAVKIEAANTITINGDISADANNATGDDGGGGSGGSIFLTTDTLAGEGSLSANGGNAQEVNAGAGAGGRIALIYTANSSNLSSITVDPGSVGRTAEEGTVYPTDMYPTLSTQSATDITGNSATANGTVEVLGNYGIIEHGHTWSDTETEPELVTPISHYKMNDNAATTTVIDSMGNNDGTATQNTTDMTTTGRINSAFSFNNSNDYISIGGTFLPTNDFTYATWLKMTNVNDETVFAASDGSGGNEFQVWFGSTMKIAIDNSYIIDTTNPINTTGVWYHLVVTRNGNTVRFHVNGEINPAVGSNSTTLNFSTCPLLIGTDMDSGCAGSLGNWFGGIIDDVRIYNQALSADQISQLYNSGTGTENLDPISPQSQLGPRSSTGTFQSSLTALDPLITYYVRSYAQVSDGQLIYGDVQTFDTTEEPQMDHLEITGNTIQTAGQAQTITLTAKDQYDNTYTGFEGDYQIIFAGPINAPDGTPPTFTDKDNTPTELRFPAYLTFTGGVATTSLSLYNAEVFELEAIELLNGYSTLDDPDYDLNITVTPATLNANETSLSLPANQTTAGTENPITITAKDQYQNPLTVGGATMVITVSGANSATPVVTDNTDGTYSASYTLTQGGTDQITATANANPIGQDTDGTSDGTFNLTVIAPVEDTSEEQELSLADSADGQLSLIVNVSDQEEQEISFDSKDDQATKIKEISLKAKDDKEVKGDIKIKKKKSKPEDVVFPSQIDACTIYTLVNIETDFSDSDLKQVKVTFRIPKGWLKENKLQRLLFVQGDKSKMASKNKWAILLAKLTSAKDDYQVYKASSDTLDAYWAVYGCEETLTTETIAPTTPPTTPPNIPTTPISQDIDQDGLLEEVTYTDLLPTYTDPDNSSQLIDTITTDNSPGLIIDTNGDDQGDILWQSQDQTTLPLDPIDLTGDPTPELLIDTDGDDQYDYYYSSIQEETQAINDSAIDLDNDGQAEHFFDLDQNDDHTQFIDPDSSSTVEATLDGDNDSNTDYLINTQDG